MNELLRTCLDEVQFHWWHSPTLLPVQSDGAFAHAELMAKANFLGCLMSEVPVGRWKGPFRGVPDPSAAGDRWGAEAWGVFKHPEFNPPPAVTPRPERSEGSAGAPLADSGRGETA